MVMSGYEFKEPISDKFWTKYQHRSEILNCRGQTPFSSLQVVRLSLSLSLSQRHSLVQLSYNF